MANSYLDLYTLDARAVAVMLRDAALAQVTHLLKGAPPHDLDPFLYGCAAQLAERGRYPRRPVEIQSLTPRAIAPAADSEAVRNQLLRYMHVQMAGSPPYRFPNLLWDLVEEWAWQDAGFKHAVDAAIRHYVAKNYLMVPGGTIQFALAPQSYWLLLALAHAAVVSQSPLARLGHFLRRQLRAAVNQPRGNVSAVKVEQLADASDRLSHWAERRVMTHGWADFWDQWLVRRARTRWVKPFANLTSEMKRCLLELPYVMCEPVVLPEMQPEDGTPELTRSVSPPSQNTTSPLAAANWLAHEPRWMWTQIPANDPFLKGSV